MRKAIWFAVWILLTGCSVTPSPVVVKRAADLTNCIYIGIVEKVGRDVADCKKKAKISAREVHATHILWDEVLPETGQRPAYVRSKLFQCN